MLAHLGDRRVHAVDLPGFGLSDPCDYSDRPLRAHAVAQLVSLLDALELERVPVAGTSLGAMWAMNLALAHPERVTSVVALGIPAVALPGMKADPFFRAMTMPGVRAFGEPRAAAAQRVRRPAGDEGSDGAARDGAPPRLVLRRGADGHARRPAGSRRCAPTSTSP